MQKFKHMIVKASAVALFLSSPVVAEEQETEYGIQNKEESKQETVTEMGMPLPVTENNQEMAKPAPVTENTTPEVSVDMDKLSETLGNFIGQSLNQPGIEINVEKLVLGIRNGVEGKPSPMSEQEYELAMTNLQENVFKNMAQNNLKKSEDFMTENAKNAQVIQIEPGKLHYEIMVQGEGKVVEEHSAPKVHFVGRFIDGEVFGTSEGMAEPIVISLDQTIPGFSKGLLGMKENEKRRLYIHPDLAYGMDGQLPPNSLLIFEVEIVKASDNNNNNTETNPQATTDETVPLSLEIDESALENMLNEMLTSIDVTPEPTDEPAAAAAAAATTATEQKG